MSAKKQSGKISGGLIYKNLKIQTKTIISAPDSLILGITAGYFKANLIQMRIPNFFFRNNKLSDRKKTNFIILSRYRSGSNLLKEGLNLIPGVKVYDEAFNLVNIEKDPETYLDPRYVSKVLNHKPEPGLITTGFKVMYGQALREELDLSYWGQCINQRIRSQIENIRCWLDQNNLPTCAFEHLLDQVIKNKEIRIVHLVRNNQLDSYLSMRLALAHDAWQDKEFGTKEGEGLDVDPLDLLRYFLQGEFFYRHYNELFKEHHVLELEYEELAGHFQKSMKKVARFIGAPSRKIPDKAPISKQNVKKSSQWIKNYEDIYTFFRGSPWEGYFEKTA